MATITKPSFSKPPLSVKDLIEKINSRGLIIDDTELITRALQKIGYYRLSIYFKPFMSHGDNFIENTVFDDITKLYQFDCNLRFICITALEKIEVAFRAAMCDRLCLQTNDPYWFLREELFIPNFITADSDGNTSHNKFLAKLEKDIRHCNEIFIESFKNKYSDTYLPSWMMVQVLPFGDCVYLYKNLKRSNKKFISDEFGLSIETFESWIYGLRVLRNHIAHYGRIWNRVFSATLTVKFKNELNYNLSEDNSPLLSGYIAVIDHFMNIIDPNPQWSQEYTNCVNKHIEMFSHKTDIQEKIKKYTLLSE